jgi:hypothetical protein
MSSWARKCCDREPTHSTSHELDIRRIIKSYKMHKSTRNKPCFHQVHKHKKSMLATTKHYAYTPYAANASGQRRCHKSTSRSSCEGTCISAGEPEQCTWRTGSCTTCRAAATGLQTDDLNSQHLAVRNSQIECAGYAEIFLSNQVDAPDDIHHARSNKSL